MSVLKQKLNRKNESGEYDEIHLKTDATVITLSPTDETLLSDEITSLKTSVSNGKSLIASAITDKGVSTASDATFQTMADNISSLDVKEPIPEQFGDGSDGIGNITSNTVWNAPTEDTGMIIKNFESLTIAQNVTVSAGNRNCGMIIRVQGDCNIYGSLVNKLSCKTLRDSDNIDFSAYPKSMLTTVAGDGGDGGTANDRTDNFGLKYSGAPGGKGMPGRFYGGGWSGGGASGYRIINSGQKYYSTCMAGGDADIINTSIDNIFIGATAAKGQYGGGGGFNASPNCSTSFAGGNGPGGNGGYESGGAGNIGGGVIILLVGGKLTITGTIDCSGGNGGNGGEVYNGNTFCPNGVAALGGGGSGGGRIFICHKGDIENAGVTNISGGSHGIYYTSTSASSKAWVSFNGIDAVNGTDGTLNIKTYEQYLEEDV